MFIGLDVPRGGRDLHCRPTSASFACRTRTTAIRNRRSRCGDSFFARVSGPYPRPDRTPPRNRGEPNPTDALAPNSASRAGHRPILQNHAGRLLKRQDPDQSDRFREPKTCSRQKSVHQYMCSCELKEIGQCGSLPRRRIWQTSMNYDDRSPGRPGSTPNKEKLPRLAARQSFFRRKAGLVPLLGAETTSDHPFAIFE